MGNWQFHDNAFTLLASAERFLRETLPIAGRIEADRIKRIDEPLYSPLARRESLANVLCHRDYSIGGGSVGVGVYDDGLEVTSCGTLHFGLTPEKLFAPHESLPRNPLIARTFYRRGVFEEWGRGTLRMAATNIPAYLPHCWMPGRTSACQTRRATRHCILLPDLRRSPRRLRSFWMPELIPMRGSGTAIPHCMRRLRPTAAFPLLRHSWMLARNPTREGNSEILLCIRRRSRWLRIMAAFLDPNLAILTALLDVGAVLSARDASGASPLHTASEYNRNPAVILLVLDAGADLEMTDNFGSTPLHAAAVNTENPAVLAARLDAGADPNVRDSYGETPWDYAKDRVILALMYAQGGGVPEDYVRAYAWYNLAAAQGNKSAARTKTSSESERPPSRLPRRRSSAPPYSSASTSRNEG